MSVQRKPIGKSIRFEVFKRDAFTCQYCGAHPPQVVLEVDHIVPVARGGENAQDNLVTACFDCNRGKRDRPLEVVPQSLSDKAAATAEREEQLRGYSAIMDAKRERIEADVWRVVGHWTGLRETSHEKFDTIKRFNDRIGVHEVLDAVDITKGAGIRGRREFKYFCAVCWNKVRALEAALNG